MRLFVVASFLLLAVAFASPQVSAAGGFNGKCTSALPGHSVCVYPDEPAFVLCASVDSKVVACIVDPCGTTMCW